MAFKLHKLNHSPQWYHDHCRAENGGYAVFRTMLTKDMKFIGADIDSTQQYVERIHTYEETWDAIMGGKNGFDNIAELGEVLERETLVGYRRSEDYTKEPFRSFTRLMEKHKLTTTELKEFIKWKAKDENLKSARSAKGKKRKPKADVMTSKDALWKRLSRKSK